MAEKDIELEELRAQVKEVEREDRIEAEKERLKKKLFNRSLIGKGWKYLKGL